MSHLEVALTIFAVFAVPSLLLCLAAMAHDAIAHRINRRRA